MRNTKSEVIFRTGDEHFLFEVHYHLKNESEHSIDAYILNECERELLRAARQLGAFYGVFPEIESLALSEGGVRSRWRLSKAKRENIALFCLLLTTLMSSLTPIRDLLRDDTLTELQKRDLELSIKEREKRLKKQELLPEPTEDDKPADSNTEEAKIKLHRSNYYKALSRVQNVTRVGFSTLGASRTASNEKIVERRDFPGFTIADTGLPSIFDSNAEIEIVAPVLKGRKIKWRGIYNGQLIGFSVIDKAYLASVSSTKIAFTAGTKINCTLELNRKLDENGNEVVTQFRVVRVKQGKSSNVNDIELF